MPIVFEVEKPNNIGETIRKLKAKLAKEGGSMSGNEKAGRIESAGVEGNYVVKDTCIEITITKCPLLQRLVIEPYVRNIFNEISSS